MGAWWEKKIMTLFDKLNFALRLYFLLPSVLCFRTGIRICHKLDSLKQQPFILPQFRRLKVQNQGLGKISSFWRHWGRISSMLFSELLLVASKPWHFLIYSCITLISASINTWPSSLCIFLCPLFFSQEYQSLDLGSISIQYHCILI